MNRNRVRIKQEGKEVSGPVVYWMQRDQRVNDNWALIYAQEEALRRDVPLYVIFSLVPKFLDATIRQYGFMLKGLEEVESRLKELNIPFILQTGNPSKVMTDFIKSSEAGLLVTDFNPLKLTRIWKRDTIKKIDIPVHEVDAHNIVPCWVVSQKEEFAAYTFRPKIIRLLDEYLDEFPKLKMMKSPSDKVTSTDWENIYSKIKVDLTVKEVDWIKPGEGAAHEALKNFINNRFIIYAEKRNDPNADAQSNLSPYLHFGHIPSQIVALSIQPLIEHPDSKKAFLEELIVRKELSDNFCYYNFNYDSFHGFHDWAQESLNIHRKDKREYVHTLKEFETAKTNDSLWNAAQMEMVKTGKMHGYMRMYWAKKILEWTKSPEEALYASIYLNDKYQLDGRDPNGYAGIAWSIGGVHDRAWSERNVFGKIRFMNFNGCKRKFDVLRYIETHLPNDPSSTLKF
ncbi:deoxyribodipyrimidine photo-lyase [Bacteroidota bacterium]